MVKYKVHEAAKDFNVKSNVIIELLAPHSDKVRKSQTALEEWELDILFDYFTQKHAVESFDAYFAMKKPVEEPVKKEEAPAQAEEPKGSEEPAKTAPAKANAPKKADAPAQQPAKQQDRPAAPSAGQPFKKKEGKKRLNKSTLFEIANSHWSVYPMKEVEPQK